MTSNAEPHRSTLAYLRPGTPFANPYQRSITSMRYQGSYRLNLARASRLPDNSREYRSGDQLNLIDWRAYARTNQLLVREVYDEASVLVRLVIDTSPSMSWPDHAVCDHIGYQVPTKLELAIRTALFCAYFHARNGDRVDIYLASEDQPYLKLQLNTAAAILSSFNLLERHQFSLAQLQSLATPERAIATSADLLLWFHDGLSPQQLQVPAKPKACQYWFHTMSELEIDPAWMKPPFCYFDDYAAPKEFLGEDLVREQQYQKYVETWLEEQKQRAYSEGINYMLITPHTPIDLFQQFLHQHRHLRVGS